MLVRKAAGPHFRHHKYFLLFLFLGLTSLMVYDTFVMAGPTTHLVLREEDVVKLSCEFLHNRDLHISQARINECFFCTMELQIGTFFYYLENKLIENFT